VTICIGVATDHPRSPRPDEPAEGDPQSQVQSLLQRADEALYQAKASGRNCVRRAVGDSHATARITEGADT
jgi:PleD family two-component response regulator